MPCTHWWWVWCPLLTNPFSFPQGDQISKYTQRKIGEGGRLQREAVECNHVLSMSVINWPFTDAQYITSQPCFTYHSQCMPQLGQVKITAVEMNTTIIWFDDSLALNSMAGTVCVCWCSGHCIRPFSCCYFFCCCCCWFRASFLKMPLTAKEAMEELKPRITSCFIYIQSKSNSLSRFKMLTLQLLWMTVLTFRAGTSVDLFSSFCCFWPLFLHMRAGGLRVNSAGLVAGQGCDMVVLRNLIVSLLH